MLRLLLCATLIFIGLQMAAIVLSSSSCLFARFSLRSIHDFLYCLSCNCYFWNVGCGLKSMCLCVRVDEIAMDQIMERVNQRRLGIVRWLKRIPCFHSHSAA